MKRLSLLALLALFLLNSCEQKNGETVPQQWQSIECNPFLVWLGEFFPQASGPQQLPPQKNDPPHPDIAYFDRYQESDFLRITVSANNQLDILHHSIYPCAYRVKPHVEFKDNKIVWWESTTKPAGINPSCICGANIEGSVTLPHLDFNEFWIYEKAYPIHFYEGLDTLIMIHTDIPFEPTVYLYVSGWVRNQDKQPLPSSQVILQNKTGEVADTIYTNENGWYSKTCELYSCPDDTLTITVNPTGLSFLYDSTQTVQIAFADMVYDQRDRDIYYHWTQYFQFDRNIPF